MSHYVYLSEGITGKSTQNKTAIPIQNLQFEKGIR